mmetsp:Transcript_25774/g.61219  ORF Transcript_25774/g.61219 Transcript_25774/m.61219 type:complete len:381 (+) Transcript_25774:29-1171(+)
MLGAGRRALLVAVCCLFIDGVSSAKRRGLQQETIDRANAALLRENTHREALLPEQVVGESFTIEYKGVRGDERTVELVDVDTIEIPPIEMGAAEGGQNLIFCPGYPVYGNITIRAVKGSDIAKINQEWWANTLKAGPDATKSDIVVTLMTKDGKPARQWKIYEAWPVMFDHGDFNPATKTASEEIVCKMSRVELAVVESEPPAASEESDFGITIEGPDGTAVEDTAWEACSGGALSLSAGPPPDCPTPGLSLLPNTEVTALSLRGPVAPGRAPLDTAVSAALLPDTLASDLVKYDEMIAETEKTLALLKTERRLNRERHKKRMVRVRAMRLNEDSQWGYADAFVTAYAFPKLGSAAAAAAPDGQPLVETVRFQALALEAK